MDPCPRDHSLIEDREHRLVVLETLPLGCLPQRHEILRCRQGRAAWHGKPTEPEGTTGGHGSEDEDGWHQMALPQMRRVEDLAQQLVAESRRVMEQTPRMSVVAVIDECPGGLIQLVRPVRFGEIGSQYE